MPLLLAERMLALFAVWLVVIVVIGQAVRGRLPIEISGRGVRYAEAATAQETAATLLWLRQETSRLSDLLLAMQSDEKRHDA